MARGRRANLSGEIYQTLRKRVLGWEYPPGYRLTEDALCQEFGVSRVPVREALHMLEEQRLVSKIPYQGCRVQQPDLQEIHELYDVRLALELFVVEKLAAEGMEETERQRLAGVWEGFALVQDVENLDSAAYARADESYHRGLAQATGNRMLVARLEEIDERLSFVRVMDIQTLPRLHETCRQHLAVLQAIGAGDVEGARGAIRRNVDFGRRNVENAIREVLRRAYLG